MTYPAHLFLQPTNTSHRQYEALRAAFAEHVPLAEIAERFHCSYGTVRNRCSQFHKKPELPFFVADERGRKKGAPHEAAPVRQETSLSRQERNRRIVELRAQQNLSAVEIAALLMPEGHPVSDSTVMRTAGLAKLR